MEYLNSSRIYLCLNSNILYKFIHIDFIIHVYKYHYTMLFFLNITVINFPVIPFGCVKLKRVITDFTSNLPVYVVHTLLIWMLWFAKYLPFQTRHISVDVPRDCPAVVRSGVLFPIVSIFFLKTLLPIPFLFLFNGWNILLRLKIDRKTSVTFITLWFMLLKVYFLQFLVWI